MSIDSLFEHFDPLQAVLILALAAMWKTNRSDRREEREDARKEREAWLAAFGAIGETISSEGSATRETLSRNNATLAALKERLR